MIREYEEFNIEIFWGILEVFWGDFWIFFPDFHGIFFGI